MNSVKAKLHSVNNLRWRIDTIKLCKYCGEIKEDSRFAKNRNKCKDCRYEESKKRHKHTCMCCGVFFTSESKTSKYCSVECRAKGRITRVDTSCSWCGKQLSVERYFYQKFKHHYCDRKCQGKHRSKEFFGEKSPKYSRVKINCACCGKEFGVIPYYFGKRKYCSEECSKKHMVGELHPRYNTKLTDDERFQNRDYPEYNIWRQLVFERDSFTCKRCRDNSGGNLVAHHIFNYAEHIDKRTDVANGITLCKECHKEFHDTFGYTNNNSEQLSIFLECDMLIPSEADTETVGTCRD